MLYEDLRFHLRNTDAEYDLIARITQHPNRPKPLRQWDQIYMLPGSQLNQAKLISGYLRDRSVVFVGDGDCMSLVIGILGREGVIDPPSHMLVLDFDDRITGFISGASKEFGFDSILEVERYNVRDPIPKKRLGKADVFYTNPPYGSKNNGKSGIFFLARCVESCKSANNIGIAILPFQPRQFHTREWSRSAMAGIQRFMMEHGYVISEALLGMHAYSLDDDPDLHSGLFMFEAVGKTDAPYKGRRLSFDEMKMFYGGKGRDFPDYIDRDGNAVFKDGGQGQI